MEQLPIYIFTFIALYAQVYLFIVLFEEWENIFPTQPSTELNHYPAVVIAVPCWNEGKTVEKTLKSLLALNYPINKLKLCVVDDGSTDNTWEVIQNFKNNFDKHNQLEILQKTNGGKHTVLNYALEKNPDCDIFGCLDADSYVYPDTLKNMLFSFENSNVMAATPMLIVRKPANLLQAVQSVEYNFGLLLKRIFGAIDAIHVTPGPFSLFRREVFQKIGDYKPAHNTEDMEITFRMQKHHMKIVSSINAYVETSTPNTVYKLYKQRLRWTQGFLQNSIDYKEMILRPKYGNVALLTIPLGWVGIFMVLYMAIFWIFHFFKFLQTIFLNFQTLGFSYIYNLSLNFSFTEYLNNILLNTSTINLLAIPIFVSGFIFIIMGHNMSLMDSRKRRYIIYFFLLWAFLVPIWMFRAAFNTIVSRKETWR